MKTTRTSHKSLIVNLAFIEKHVGGPPRGHVTSVTLTLTWASAHVRRVVVVYDEGGGETAGWAGARSLNLHRTARNTRGGTVTLQS